MKRTVSLLALLAVGSCRDAETERLKLTTKASYDQAGRLAELTYDADKDGRIDTWTEMNGARPVRSRLDRNGDGKLDRWEYYDDTGQLQKVGFSRNDDGTVDAWAYSGADGRVERIEMSSSADEQKIDRWERYDAAGLVAADEDRDGDGRIDTWQTYAGGALTTAAFDETHDGRPDRRLTYESGALATIESAPDASGHFTTTVDARRPGHPSHRP